MNDDFTTGFDNSFGVGGNDFAVYDPLDVTDLSNYADITGISPLSFYHAVRQSEETDRMFAESEPYLHSTHNMIGEANIHTNNHGEMLGYPLQQTYFADRAAEPVPVSSEKAPLSATDVFALVIAFAFGLAVLSGFIYLGIIVYKTNFVY